MEDKYLSQLKELIAQNVDAQSKAFLRAFVTEFQGKFEQVLDLVEEFRTYLPPGNTDGQLDEQQAHLFLEKKGEAQTVIQFRDKMKQIDLDFNKRVSVIEYLLYKYQKTTKDLFESKPNAHLIKMLEDAIEQYQAVFRERKEKENKIAELEKIIAQGGKEAAKAKSELAHLKMQDPAKEGANEISSLAAKLKAKRALANPEEENRRIQEEAFKQEQQRLAEEKRLKDAEDKKRANDSKQRLKDKAKLWS